MKKALFGKHIPVSCEYCEHYDPGAQPSPCVKGKEIKNDNKCRSFKYDPLMRVPATAKQEVAFTAADFRF